MFLKKTLSSTDASAGLTDTCVRRAAVDVGIRHVRAYAKRANSEDSIEVLSTTESIILEDLTAITEEEAEQQSLSNGFANEEEPRTEVKSHIVPKEEKTLNAAAAVSEDEDAGPVEEEEDCVGREEPLKQTMVTEGATIREQPNTVKMNPFHKGNTEEKKRLHGNTCATILNSEAPVITSML